MKNTTNNIGERLKLIRIKQGMSQAKFAEMFGISPASITSYELNRAKPSLEFFTTLIEKYNININWVITGMGQFQLKMGERSCVSIGDHCTFNNHESSNDQNLGERSNETCCNNVSSVAAVNLDLILCDQRELDLLQITDEEVKFLRGIKLDCTVQPDKEFFIEALRFYRRYKRKSG